MMFISKNIGTIIYCQIGESYIIIIYYVYVQNVSKYKFKIVYKIYWNNLVRI